MEHREVLKEKECDFKRALWKMFIRVSLKNCFQQMSLWVPIIRLLLE
jgi:hypothetical protein